MTMTAERPCETEPSMSVVDRNVIVGKEVNTMIASTALERRVAPRARPSGLDRLVMRVSLAMLLWARRHAGRRALSREEQLRRFDVQADAQRREHAALQLVRRY